MIRSHRRLACLGALALVAASVGAGPLAAQDPAVQQTQEGVSLNLQGVELAQAIATLAESAGISVVTSDLPDAEVTLRTAQPVPIEDVRALIEQLAVAHGATIQQVGGFLRIQGPPEGIEPAPPRHLFVYRLEHARAPYLAATLQALFGGGSGIPPARGTSATPLSQQLGALQQQSAAGFVGGGVQTSVPQNVTITAGGGDLEGDLQIVPEETTNTLLVRATETDWALVEQAILALDLRPLQVVIEVVIAEVRRSDEQSLGVSFTVEGDDVVAELPGGIGLEDFAVQLGLSGDDVDISATLAALGSSGNVQILSRPVIQAQNNLEARINVGEQRPFVQVSRSTDLEVQDEIIQYQDVGTVLTILPTINENGYVNMVLTQEVNSATAEREFGAPVISTREATTQLLARSGQTVVIGGLVDSQTEEMRTGIPFLKDIPLLGLLFGRTSERVVNSELFLFLTPYVVASDADADAVREAIEDNAELTESMLPLPPILPPVVGPLLPDTARDSTSFRIRPDTGGAVPDTGGAVPDTSGVILGTAGVGPPASGGGR